jgi:hypothetical protein
MEHSPGDRHAAVVETYEFSGVRVVVDVGGGNGALLKSTLAVNAETMGVLYDQDGVVASAHALLKAAGLASWCRV